VVIISDITARVFNLNLKLYTTRAGPFLGPLEGTELGFTALPWAPLGWRQLQTVTYQE
jgi:hypothetical protein